MQKRWKLSNIKNYYCFILLDTFVKFSGYDHTILINEYLKNFDFTMLLLILGCYDVILMLLFFDIIASKFLRYSFIRTVWSWPEHQSKAYNNIKQ